MKKFVYLTLALFVFSLKLAVADESKANSDLVPASSLEEMINAGVSMHSNVTDFDHREVACFARNRHGKRFEARGFNPREAQERVMHECRRVSEQCFEIGCREVESNLETSGEDPGLTETNDLSFVSSDESLESFGFIGGIKDKIVRFITNNSGKVCTKVKVCSIHNKEELDNAVTFLIVTLEPEFRPFEGIIRDYLVHGGINLIMKKCGCPK